jgi:hypothetical protein
VFPSHVVFTFLESVVRLISRNNILFIRLAMQKIIYVEEYRKPIVNKELGAYKYNAQHLASFFKTLG